MRGTIKTMRDAEVALLKMLQKAKGKKTGAGVDIFDPKRPKAVRVYVATQFPEWQDMCVGIVREAYDETTDKVDDAQVKELLAKKGLIKDKRAMPFIQAFKVCLPRTASTTRADSIHLLETHGPVRCTNRVPPHPSLL